MPVRICFRTPEFIDCKRQHDVANKSTVVEVS
jgi:hypothetical protein